MLVFRVDNGELPLDKIDRLMKEFKEMKESLTKKPAGGSRRRIISSSDRRAMFEKANDHHVALKDAINDVYRPAMDDYNKRRGIFIGARKELGCVQQRHRSIQDRYNEDLAELRKENKQLECARVAFNDICPDHYKRDHECHPDNDELRKKADKAERVFSEKCKSQHEARKAFDAIEDAKRDVDAELKKAQESYDKAEKEFEDKAMNVESDRGFELIKQALDLDHKINDLIDGS